MSYDDYMALVPCILLGLFCGAAQYFKGFNDDLQYKPSVRRCIGTMMGSAIVSFIVFGILDIFEFTFLTKLAICSGVAFLGIDKALELVERLFALRKGGGKDV